MATSVQPETQDELDRALAKIRGQKAEPTQPSIEDALAGLRAGGKKKDVGGDIDLGGPSVEVSQPKGVVGPHGESLITSESMSDIAAGRHGLAPAIGAALRLGRGRLGYQDIGNVAEGDKTDLPIVTADKLEAPGARAKLSKDVRKKTAPGTASTATNLALTAGMGLIAGREITDRAEDAALERYTEGGGDASKNAELLAAASAGGAAGLQIPLVVTPAGTGAPVVEEGERLIWGNVTKRALAAAAKRSAKAGAESGAVLVGEGAIGDVASGQKPSTIGKRAAENFAAGAVGGSVLHGLGEVDALVGTRAAARQAQYDALAAQHPEWFGESTSADVETRASRTLANPNAPKATATLAEQPAAATEPDYTVDEPIIQQKGVFGGALEQHGKDFAEGKVEAPAVNTVVNTDVNNAPTAPTAGEGLATRKPTVPADWNVDAKPSDPDYIPTVDAIRFAISLVGKEGLQAEAANHRTRGENQTLRDGLALETAARKIVSDARHSEQNLAEAKDAFARQPALPPELPATIEAVDDAIDANAERYRASTDPAERADILKLQELLEDHREELSGAASDVKEKPFETSERVGNEVADLSDDELDKRIAEEEPAAIERLKKEHGYALSPHHDPAYHAMFEARRSRQDVAAIEKSGLNALRPNGKKPSNIDEAIVHNIAGGPADSWTLATIARLKLKGAADEEIRAALDHIWGLGGGGMKTWHKGGKVPSFAFGDSPHAPKGRSDTVELKGPKVVKAVRRLFDIPEPGVKEETPAKYDYSSTQLDLSPKEAEGIKRLAATIPDEDLAEHGRENTPHITVKYGLHGQPIAKLKKLLEGQGPITLTFGKTSFFPDRGEGDVVKVDVGSPALHALNKKIADALPHTDTFPDYKPHATVAYVKPGLGKKYSGNDALAGEEITVDTLTFSDKGGQTEEIKLREKAPPKRLGQKKPVEPVHESARLPSGRLRDNLAAVKTDGLVREMFQLLGAEDPTDQQRAIYRTVTDDPNMSGPVTVPTIRGGRNLQAEALHRIELKKGAAKRIEAVLNARGLSDEEITRRYAELTETEADLAAEREGLDNDKGDTSFDFGDEEGNNESDVRVAERTVAPKGANAPAEGAAEEGAAAVGQGERAGAPEPQGEPSEVARKRAELYHQLHTASTPSARFNVIERIKALDQPKPEIKGAIAADKMAERARAGETRDAVKDITGEEATPLSRDKKQSEMFGSEVETPPAPKEQDDLFSMQRSLNGYDQAVHDLWNEAGTHGRLELLDQWRRMYPEQEFLPEWADRDAEDLPAHVREKIGMERVKQAIALKDLGALQRLDEDWRAPNEKTFSPIAKGLANGVPLGAGTQMYDTEGNASRATLDKLAQRPHTRQMAVRFMAVFDQIHAAIAKRYTFEPVRFGGLDVSMGSVGMNIKPRAGGGNFILTNPYTALMEVGLSGRLRPSEYAAALSERTFATMVHEIAHQPARGHDELFSSYLTRYAGAAAPIAHLVLPELDQAWQVALENGFKDDLVTVQHEVWNHELERHVIRPEPTEGSPDRLSLGGDATASYLRPSEGDGGLGEGNGRRRLGVHADVRAGARGSQVEGSERAKSGGPDRADEKGSAGTAAQSPRLKLPEPSGLSQPRSSIRPGEFVRALKAFLNPETLGPEALGAAGTIRHQSAAAYHRVAVTVAALKDLQGRVEKLSREDQVKLWDDAEHGRPIGDAALDEGNRLLRRATEQRTQQLIKLDRLKANRVIENYVGRFWSKTTSASGRDFLRAIMGRRPLEGPKSFLKARDLDWFVDGLKRADLVPATYNYVESQLAKIAEMERVIAAEHMLRQEQELGRAKPIMLGVEPPLDYRGEKWVKIDKTGEDPAFTIYLPPDVPHWEAVDTIVFGKLQKLIDTLNVEHTRAVKIGGNRLGFAEGDKHITTKFGGAEGVVMHELGHILDARYGLRNEIEKGIGRAPTRTVTKGKRAGKQVPDYKSEDKDAATRRKQLREELRQLANLRRETLAGVPETKDLGQTDRSYLHSWPEKMANMVEAYISARARFQQVAPGIFGIFDRIIEEHPELKPLRDIQPSLSREAHGASTRVPGVITGGHWYAPRDAAAVWNAHLSKGLAGNAIYDAAIAPIHAGTQMLLGFSGFHGTVIATEGAFSDIALAIDNLANKGGVASQAPKQVARAFVSPIAGVSFGRKVMQEYRLPGSHPELKEVLDAMIAGGFRGRATSELWSGDRKDKLKRAFREALFSESKGRRLWGAARLPADALWAGVEFASGPLMSKYVPLMKTAATYNAVAQALEKLPLDTPIDELHRIMGDVVKEMDYRFGQVDYDNHFINRVAKDFAQLVFLAPGWTFGTMALAGRGLSDVARLPVRALKAAGGGNGSRSENGEVPPELVGRSAAYWIGAVLGTMLINGTLTYFNTGERPSGKDYFAFRDGTKDAAGNWNRHTVPGYLMHDIYGWARHPVHTFKNKFAPTLAFMGRLAENKDYFGDQIYDPEAQLPTKAKQAGWALLKEHMPLSVQNYLEGKQRGEAGAGEVARNVFGVTPARRELVRTPAQNKMSEYVALHAPETRTLEEAGKAKLHRDVLAAVRAGDDLPQSAFDAVTEGTLKPKLLGQWIDEATRTSTVAQFKSLTLEQAATVWDLANDDEKALWAAAFRTKLQNARR